MSHREIIKSKATPLPWHIYEGGNFVRIGAEGYDEYVQKNSYLGGPLHVAEVNFHATEGHDADPAKALANAEIMVLATRCHTALVDALRAYMFVEQTNGGRNPHKPGTNRHKAFELGRAALAEVDK